jgi:predicted PolB exonuclease-like 3'-5' exonuclease
MDNSNVDVQKCLSGNEKLASYLARHSHEFDAVVPDEFRKKIEAIKEKALALGKKKVNVHVKLDSSTYAMYPVKDYVNLSSVLDWLVLLFDQGRNKELCFFVYEDIRENVDFYYRRHILKQC